MDYKKLCHPYLEHSDCSSAYLVTEYNYTDVKLGASILVGAKTEKWQPVDTTNDRMQSMFTLSIHSMFYLGGLGYAPTGKLYKFSLLRLNLVIVLTE